MKKKTRSFFAAFRVLVLLVSSLSPAAVTAPEITGEICLNSEPVSMRELRGKVVLVEFSTWRGFGNRACRPST